MNKFYLILSDQSKFMDLSGNIKDSKNIKKLIEYDDYLEEYYDETLGNILINFERVKKISYDETSVKLIFSVKNNLFIILDKKSLLNTTIKKIPEKLYPDILLMEIGE